MHPLSNKSNKSSCELGCSIFVLTTGCGLTVATSREQSETKPAADGGMKWIVWEKDAGSEQGVSFQTCSLFR